MSCPGKFKYRCMAKNCQNAYYYSQSPPHSEGKKTKSFFRFPEKDPERRSKWFSIMQLEPSAKRLYLCEDHFELKYFYSTQKNRLTPFAVPYLDNSASQRTHTENITTADANLVSCLPSTSSQGQIAAISDLTSKKQDPIVTNTMLPRKRKLEFSSEPCTPKMVRKQRCILSSIN